MKPYIKRGKAMRLTVLKRYDLQIRIAKKTKRSDANAGCWIVEGFTHDGYGQIKIEGKSIWLHRASYAAYTGPIAAGQTIHHICHNRSCVRPSHLIALPITGHNNGATKCGEQPQF